MAAAGVLTAKRLTQRKQTLDTGVETALRARHTSVKPSVISNGISFPETLTMSVPQTAGEMPAFLPGCALSTASGCHSRAAPDRAGRRCAGIEAGSCHACGATGRIAEACNREAQHRRVQVQALTSALVPDPGCTAYRRPALVVRNPGQLRSRLTEWSSWTIVA